MDGVAEGPAPHDLLRVRGPDSLVLDGELPNWAVAALRRAPFVVVRRARPLRGLIPVGIRGFQRDQRLAAFLHPSGVLDRVTPERLAEERLWPNSPRTSLIPALAALGRVKAFMSGLRWGPGGSVGFELASGVQAASPESDLDLIIRADVPPVIHTARRLLDFLDTLPVRVDTLLEMPFGGLALSELARGGKTVMIRTDEGPRLVRDLWVRASATS